ncbi:hypothetical protein WN51_05221 [Melipona quadrifasciata]|uniref:Uncharacterized protein n=1 Tax=Melipona quadrifasciata TaxID=166423 RepID=A0A0N0U3N9_9HYME|nr:hypothetical protein WN51_05221 [Melipona quadrifasciata]
MELYKVPFHKSCPEKRAPLQEGGGGKRKLLIDEKDEESGSQRRDHELLEALFRRRCMKIREKTCFHYSHTEINQLADPALTLNHEKMNSFKGIEKENENIVWKDLVGWFETNETLNPIAPLPSQKVWFFFAPMAERSEWSELRRKRKTEIKLWIIVIFRSSVGSDRDIRSEEYLPLEQKGTRSHRVRRQHRILVFHARLQLNNKIKTVKCGHKGIVIKNIKQEDYVKISRTEMEKSAMRNPFDGTKQEYECTIRFALDGSSGQLAGDYSADIARLIAYCDKNFNQGSIELCSSQFVVCVLLVEGPKITLAVMKKEVEIKAQKQSYTALVCKEICVKVSEGHPNFSSTPSVNRKRQFKGTLIHDSAKMADAPPRISINFQQKEKQKTARLVPQSSVFFSVVFVEFELISLMCLKPVWMRFLAISL